MNDDLIECEGVTKTFMTSNGFFRTRRPLHAVNGVDLKIGRGEVVGLVGESGCGKTTLAKIILGLELPTSGAIRLLGRTLNNFRPLELASLLQPIFQDPYSSLNPRKSIGSIITLPLKVQGDPQPESWRKRVEQMMEVVGLPSRLFHNYPSQLSGGQRQRVAIARALINRPKIVICDEPTSALDVSVQSQILNLLLDLQGEFNLTYIFISHNLAVVEHMATRVAVMYLGRIVEEAEANEFFSNPRHPYSKALLKSILMPQPGLGIPETDLGAAYPNPLEPPLGCTFHPRCPAAIEKCQAVPPRPTLIGRTKVECHLYENVASMKMSMIRKSRPWKHASPAGVSR